MAALSSYAHVSTLAGTERVPVVVTPGVAGGNAYITADEQAAATPFSSRYVTVPTAWTAVTFANSWVDFGAPWQVCQYRKVGDMVQIRGLMKSGTISLTSFTLPAGFRPPAGIGFPAQSNGAFGSMTIDSAGVFVPVSGSNVAYWINSQYSVTA